MAAVPRVGPAAARVLALGGVARADAARFASGRWLLKADAAAAVAALSGGSAGARTAAVTSVSAAASAAASESSAAAKAGTAAAAATAAKASSMAAATAPRDGGVLRRSPRQQQQERPAYVDRPVSEGAEAQVARLAALAGAKTAVPHAYATARADVSELLMALASATEHTTPADDAEDAAASASATVVQGDSLDETFAPHMSRWRRPEAAGAESGSTLIGVMERVASMAGAASGAASPFAQPGALLVAEGDTSGAALGVIPRDSGAAGILTVTGVVHELVPAYSGGEDAPRVAHARTVGLGLAYDSAQADELEAALLLERVVSLLESPEAVL